MRAAVSPLATPNLVEGSVIVWKNGEQPSHRVDKSSHLNLNRHLASKIWHQGEVQIDISTTSFRSDCGFQKD